MLAISDHENTENINLFKSTYGLLFFGVPNLGLRHEQLREMLMGNPISNWYMIYKLQMIQSQHHF